MCYCDKVCLICPGVLDLVISVQLFKFVVLSSLIFVASCSLEFWYLLVFVEPGQLFRVWIAILPGPFFECGLQTEGNI